MSARIDPRAVVDPSAELADGVEVGPYAFVGPKAVLGEGTRVLHHGTVHGWTRLGQGNVVWPYASIGGDPQDYSYRGEEVWLEAGDRNVFREFVTVSRGTSKEQRVTRLGSDCLLMACAHVGHDCVLGNGILLANNVLLAGHCHLEDRCILSGNVAVNHFTTIGRLAYVGGLSRIAMDVPPFMLVEGNPSRVAKVNIVGLQRAGFAEDRIKALRHAFRAIWRSEELVRESVLGRLEKDPAVTEDVLHLVAFLRRQMGGEGGRAREKDRK